MATKEEISMVGFEIVAYAGDAQTDLLAALDAAREGDFEKAEQLHKAMQEQGMKLDYVVEIDLPRNIARDRIMGRRVCKNDGNHPNNIFIDAIKPNGDACRVCGGELTARADDQDEAAINKRHDIYYDDKTGTLAAAHYFKALAEKGETKYIVLNGQGTIDSIKETLIKELGLN